MTSIGTGLRMMQAGGVDRTGFADIADALGTPGLDLIRKRREEQGLAALLASLSENQIEPTVDKPVDEKGMTSLSFSDVALGLLDPVTTGIDLIKGASKRMTPEEISLFYQGDPMDQLYGGYGFDKSREMFDLQKGDTNIFGNEVLMDSPMLVDPEVRALYESALGMKQGGRVGLVQGGPSQQGQTQRGGLEGGRRGFGGPTGGGGGNQKPQKEVDIDQLKKEEEEKAKMVTTKTTLNPALYGLVEDQLSLQTPPEPMQEQSFLDTVSKYNPLQQDFQVTPNLSFGYDVNPNLKDLSDINATAGFSYSFNQGGPVSVGIDDNKKTLRISEDDKFIEAEQMLRGDTELYNYLVGGEIMPGLSFELGVMDDAVMEPGMRSPDDLKFFNIKKTF
mgnify:FL=1